MPSNIDIGFIALWFVVLLFSLSFHEAAHAWTSEKFGDDTGRLQGRITLNPMAHIDPFGTVLFPLLSAVTGIPLLGWAKPVETNPLLWRDKRKANISVSAAGPLSNFILSGIAFVILKAMLIMGTLRFAVGHTPYHLLAPAPGQPEYLQPLALFLGIMLVLNLALGIFNLLPIPPLDGSHVLESLLPYEMAQAFVQIRPYGFFFLIALLYLGVLSIIFSPVYRFVVTLLLS